MQESVYLMFILVQCQDFSVQKHFLSREKVKNWVQSAINQLLKQILNKIIIRWYFDAEVANVCCGQIGLQSIFIETSGIEFVIGAVVALFA